MAFVKNLITGGPDPEKANVVDPFSNNQVVNATQKANDGLVQQQQFAQALAAQNGIGNQSQVFAQQQQLANQLQAQANGQGPNVAQDQLNQSTGQNIANQAAMAAGQRGAAQNVGLIARQAGMQGAATQQQAVGQAATLGAQQQLAAQQQLGAQQAQMAQLAGNQVGQQANAQQAYNTGALQLQQNNVNAVTGQNAAENTATANFNSAQNQQTQNSFAGLGALGGLASGIGAVGSMLGSKAPAAVAGGASGGFAGSSGLGNVAYAAKGGAIESAPKGPASMMGRHMSGAMMMKQGGPVPGHAAVKGDSLKNDTVPAMLSPGEVVLPRHVMNHKDPPKMAAEFVRQVMAKKGKKK